ncbi:MAG: hypothetical protein ACXVRI_04655 [Gaiellaceae bacterium]
MIDIVEQIRCANREGDHRRAARLNERLAKLLAGSPETRCPPAGIDDVDAALSALPLHAAGIAATAKAKAPMTVSRRVQSMASVVVHSEDGRVERVQVAWIHRRHRENAGSLVAPESGRLAPGRR